MLLNQIQTLRAEGKKMFALLIDPDKHTQESLRRLAMRINGPLGPDVVLVGGSLVSNDTGATVATLKSVVETPVFLFPGNLTQITDKADGILLLSLISGRNPEYLIGQHVMAASALAKSKMEIIPTGYMLIGSDNYTSVRYVSNTMPIPGDKPDIAVATALAGQMLGLKMIYLEGGSGATTPVSVEMIKSVRSAIELPIAVGGGLRSAQDVKRALESGADMAVVGTSIEHDETLIESIAETVRSF